MYWLRGYHLIPRSQEIIWNWLPPASGTGRWLCGVPIGEERQRQTQQHRKDIGPCTSDMHACVMQIGLAPLCPCHGGVPHRAELKENHTLTLWPRCILGNAVESVVLDDWECWSPPGVFNSVDLRSRPYVLMFGSEICYHKLKGVLFSCVLCVRSPLEYYV